MTSQDGEYKRRNFTKAQQLRIWMRDAWHCRYCAKPMFFPPTLKLLDRRCPGHSYYHPGGRAGMMLPLFRWGWASVDHIVPVTGGGSNEDENLVAACWWCNLRKGNVPLNEKLQLRDVSQDLKALCWDGMCTVYPKLAEKPDEWTRLIEKIYA